MSDDIDVLKPDTVLKPKIDRPRLYKVVLINDDYTPRELVVQVLKAVFRTTEDQSYRIMMTGHQRGACIGDLRAQSPRARPRKAPRWAGRTVTR